MQAIILAAGMGRRLGELTKDNTKCMVEVNGVRLIDRLLNQLAPLGLNRVVIVVGYEGQKLRDYIGDRYADRLHIEYVNNPVYDKTNNIYSLALAKEQLQEDDTLLIESDLIFDDAMFSLILNDQRPNLALVAKYQTWMDGTMVCIDDDCNIVNFVPKQAFNYADTNRYYKTVNIYKFSRDFSRHKYVPFLEAYSKAMGNNEYYEQVLRVITFLDKSDLKALPITNEKWYEIDDIQDLDIASTIFADDESRKQLYMRRYGGYWRFPEMLDFCYLVNPYFPTQRMRDEMRANFDTLLTEYPSGMYVNSLLASKCFNVRQEYMAVGNGAAELIKGLMESETDKVGVVYPTFEEYPHRLQKEQIVPFFPANKDCRYTADDLKAFYADKELSTLLLINPDNPSGNFIPVPDVLMLAAWCQDHGIRLILDESFVDFSQDWETSSLLDNGILQAYPNLIVVKSISKSFGVPGLRLGILASANKELIAQIKKEVSIWNLNSFAEFFMQIYTKYEKDYKRACEKFQMERTRFYHALSAVPFLRVIPSEANYFLCEVTDRFSSTELTERLLKDYNILIKDCDTKNGLQDKNYIRVAVRNTADNNRLVKVLMSL